MSDGVPLVQLEEGGTAPVLRYDLPEPTSYEGKNFVELDFEEDIFLPVASEAPVMDDIHEMLEQSPESVKSEVEQFVSSGLSSRPTLNAVPRNMIGRHLAASGTGGSVIADPGGDTGPVTPPPPPPEPLPLPPEQIDAGDILLGFEKGNQWVPGTGVDGEPTVEEVPVPDEPDPHLYLVETLRLSSFLGDYGAGRIVKTFSLLPGEKTRISVRTFLQKESTRKQASSVLDSLTKESSRDLETSVTREQSDQRSYKKTKEYYADAEASASWGWGSAKVKAGIKGSSNSSREESVKNVANATEKHASRASAKREVEINTSYEETAKTEEELAIERDIENINLSRTLNFVFRQMNQKFVTAVHLTDVRVAFFNGDRSSRREVPLARLDALLEEVVKPEKRTEVRNVILEQLTAVRGRDGIPVNLLRQVQLGQDDNYIQFDNTLTSVVHDREGRPYGEVAGLLMHQDELVMRTEGVVVESLLGQGDALDSYATELQQLEVQRRRADVQQVQGRANQLLLINQAIANGDEQLVSRAEKLACVCDCPSGKRDAAHDGGNGPRGDQSEPVPPPPPPVPPPPVPPPPPPPGPPPAPPDPGGGDG